MAQGISNYSFAINSTYDPFTFQELLTPYVMYKDAFEKTETAYDDLTTKADKFKYLGQQLEGEDSKAAQIYKGYADELHKQADDLAKHGLNMSNRRGLTSLKQRYASEIGRLDLAQTAMDEEKKRRRDLYGKDSSLLYATDNLRLDDFLDESTPNLYSISGNELYTRGAAAGKAASSRVYSAGDVGSTLGGYYRDWVEKYGYNADSINAFRANVAAIPELQQSVDSILQERGVNTNLTGANLQRARQAVINGIIDGAVYQESHKPVRDEGVLSAAQRDESARSWSALKLQKKKWKAEKEQNDFLMGKTTRTVKHENGTTDEYTVLPDNKIQVVSKDKDGNVTGTSITTMSGKSDVSSPEESAVRAIAIENEKNRLRDAAKVAKATTREEVEKLGYVSIGSTIWSSTGSLVHWGGHGPKSTKDAMDHNDYRNIEGWRSGQAGQDIVGMGLGTTAAPNVDFWGNFSYPSKNKKGKMLSDEEFANLPEATQLSILKMLESQGYSDVDFQVMEIKEGNRKPSYTTFVKQEDLILTGKEK